LADYINLADSPHCECQSYLRQMAEVKIYRDVLGGTPHMRQLGETYLPKEPAESDESYEVRLGRATLFPALEVTVDGLTGMVFRKLPVLDDKAPDLIKQWWLNIDLEGTHGNLFVRQLFEEGMDGHDFILVDMQRPVTADNPEATRADEMAAGIRPYWVLIRKDQIINWQAEMRGGRKVLTQVTIKECVTRAVGKYGDEEVIQYRVLRPGSWELWELMEATDEDGSITGKKGEKYMKPVLMDSGTTPLDEIPLYPYYAKKKGFLESAPPLLQLAYQNIEHFQLKADYRHNIHIVAVPIRYIKGWDENKGALEVGPFALVILDDNGEIGYAEASGESIPNQRLALIDTMEEMARTGLRILAQKPQVQVTATEFVGESEVQTSDLGVMAMNLEDCVNNALAATAKWVKIQDTAKVTINRKFTKMAIDAQKITVFSKMVADSQLPIEVLWQLLVEAEELPTDFNPENAKALIELKVKEAQKANQNNPPEKTGVDQDKAE